ncbi:MAG: sulfotransferase [Sphingomonadaceae bacterium]|nr:MAG: sulfotransferase [Sphingomonadaceae bacterium]
MKGGPGRRARTVEEFGQNMAALHAHEPVHFKPYAAPGDDGPRDVFIASWAKSGTTMMQQMFHQLRMVASSGRGDMDFDDISRMTPWEDTAMMLDLDMTAPQRALPRGFKSHREYERLPAGQRYVVTLRDPKECYVSFHRFFDGWHIERGAVPMEDFWDLFMSGGPGGCDYATHLLSWWARRDEPDTLLATYRWAAKNRREMIARMAAFLGLQIKGEGVATVEIMTDRAFMRDYMDRFDDAMVCAVMEEKLGIPASSDSSKVQSAGSDSRELPPAMAERIDDLWADRVQPATGHADFTSLAAELDARMDAPAA